MAAAVRRIKRGDWRQPGHGRPKLSSYRRDAARVPLSLPGYQRLGTNHRPSLLGNTRSESAALECGLACTGQAETRRDLGASPGGSQCNYKPVESRVSGRRIAGTRFRSPAEARLDAQYQLSLWLLFGSVLVMLLIGCVNIAGLLLARG